MYDLRSVWRASCLLAGLTLSGCATNEAVKGWSNRYGPDGDMPVTSVRNIARSQAEVMEAFEQASPPTVDRTGATNYYPVVLAGFNYADQVCDAYLHELFAIDSERSRATKGISTVGGITTAALAISPPSGATMALVSQVFNLGGLYVDSIADSYLFGAKLPIIVQKVADLQQKYRDDVKAGKTDLTSRAAAFASIRGYLRLCMPPVIESKLTDAIAKSNATSDATTDKKTTTPNVRLETQ